MFQRTELVKYCMNQETGVVRPAAIVDDYDGDYEDYADDAAENLPLEPRNNLLRLRQQQQRQQQRAEFERLEQQQQQQQQQLQPAFESKRQQQQQQQPTAAQIQRQRQIQRQLERLNQLQEQAPPGFSAVNVKNRDLPRQLRKNNPLFPRSF